MEEGISYNFTHVRQRRESREEINYELILRQQPKQSRMCGIGEKADRRPIDPPPIIQLKVYDSCLTQPENSSFLQNPYYFMYASLVAPDTDEELHLLRDGKTRSTTGSVVSSLYHLKDTDNSDAGFFVFPDLSVRMEGTYRLKLSLFEIIGYEIYHCKSIFSDVFIVYSAKRFPGMEESTFLSRSFADQGLKIRIRKEIRIRSRRIAKRDRKELDHNENTNKTKNKRARANNKIDDESHGSITDDDNDAEMQDRGSVHSVESSKASPDSSQAMIVDKQRDNATPTSPHIRTSYTHQPPPPPPPPHVSHYEQGYPGYHRQIPWHERPDYLQDPHYPPYYDPYDRRYAYHHPYYYPPPPPHLPDASDHRRYSYPPPHHPLPPPSPYPRTMYPGQAMPGYYGTTPDTRVSSRSSTESSSTPRPYAYESTGPYPPPPPRWSHYHEHPKPRDINSDSSPTSSYRPSGPMTSPHPHPMYPYPPPDYYGPYAHLPPPHLPSAIVNTGTPSAATASSPQSKTDNRSTGQPDSNSTGQQPSAKIAIQDLVSSSSSSSSSEKQTNSNVEHSVNNASNVSSSSSASPPSKKSQPPSLPPHHHMYATPPSTYSHYYPLPPIPIRGHEYPFRHDMYGQHSRHEHNYQPPRHDAPTSQYSHNNHTSTTSNKNTQHSSNLHYPSDLTRSKTNQNDINNNNGSGGVNNNSHGSSKNDKDNSNGNSSNINYNNNNNDNNNNSNGNSKNNQKSLSTKSTSFSTSPVRVRSTVSLPPINIDERYSSVGSPGNNQSLTSYRPGTTNNTSSPTKSTTQKISQQKPSPSSSSPSSS